MAPDDQLDNEMIAMYRRAGEEVGYWGRRFLQAVRRPGDLALSEGSRGHALD